METEADRETYDKALERRKAGEITTDEFYAIVGPLKLNNYDFDNAQQAAFEMGIKHGKKDVREYLMTLEANFENAAMTAEEKGNNAEFSINLAKARLARELINDIFKIRFSYIHGHADGDPLGEEQ